MSAPEAINSGEASYNSDDSGGEESWDYKDQEDRDIQEDDGPQEDGDFQETDV